MGAAALRLTVTHRDFHQARAAGILLFVDCTEWNGHVVTSARTAYGHRLDDGCGLLWRLDAIAAEASGKENRRNH